MPKASFSESEKELLFEKIVSDKKISSIFDSNVSEWTDDQTAAVLEFVKTVTKKDNVLKRNLFALSREFDEWNENRKSENNDDDDDDKYLDALKEEIEKRKHKEVYNEKGDDITKDDVTKDDVTF